MDKLKLKEINFEEISLDEIDTLEETTTPGFGIICGNGCWGIGCW